ncbi:MAG: TetR/AcrR family transcriptional regulator [Chloroflexi bacterium]|nr:MAG: TetR/AcrR family transcriptional regulator [Chloroflexota bacterium]
MTATEVRRRQGGRSARVRQAVLEATLAVLRESGPDQLTVADVARRSRVHETSIYRRWGSRQNLMLDALLGAQDQRMPVPNTGSLYGDLLALATERAEYLSGSHGRALLRSMVMSSDDAVLIEMRDDFLQARFQSLKPLFDRAIDRGESLVETDPRLLLEMLFGPLYFRVLISREPIDREFLEHLVDRVAAVFGITGR